MIIPYSVILWIGLALFVILVAIAVAHVIQGLRFANNDQRILSATLTFMISFAVITGLGLMLIREVDWHGEWSISVPTLTEESPQ